MNEIRSPWKMRKSRKGIGRKIRKTLFILHCHLGETQGSRGVAFYFLQTRRSIWTLHKVEWKWYITLLAHRFNVKDLWRWKQSVCPSTKEVNSMFFVPIAALVQVLRVQRLWGKLVATSHNSITFPSCSEQSTWIFLHGIIITNTK